MLFTSLPFLVFFAVAVALYWATPAPRRWIALLASSACFYGWGQPAYLPLLAACMLSGYAAGRGLERARSDSARRTWLALAVAVNLGLVAGFKLAGSGDPLHSWIPVGLSFYAFQTVGYVIDVHRGRLAPERHLGRFALFVCFFPQLVAGPIERGRRLLPQIRSERHFDATRAREGLALMLRGFVLKLVIADRLGGYVDAVYAAPDSHSGAQALLATYLFAFQLFCDFAGYTDIARGAARVLGFELMENFKRPFFAASVRAFWQRWHISLSSWFRDYVYLPLGATRLAHTRWQADTLLVFALLGLWHGASWNFAAWGLLQGLFLAVGESTRSLRSRLRGRLGLDQRPGVARALAILCTFHLLVASLILFRAHSFGDAQRILVRIARGASGNSTLAEPLGSYELGIGLLGVLILLGWHAWLEWGRPLGTRLAESAWLRWPLYYAGLTALLTLGEFGLRDFVYFRF